jgi:hypothetical protein
VSYDPKTYTLKKDIEESLEEIQESLDEALLYPGRIVLSSVPRVIECARTLQARYEELRRHLE